VLHVFFFLLFFQENQSVVLSEFGKRLGEVSTRLISFWFLFSYKFVSWRSFSCYISWKWNTPSSHVFVLSLIILMSDTIPIQILLNTCAKCILYFVFNHFKILLRYFEIVSKKFVLRASWRVIFTFFTTCFFIYSFKRIKVDE